MRTHTSSILMVSPAQFGHNHLTASTNAFQIDSAGNSADQVKDLAIDEFNILVHQLRTNGVHVNIAFDTPEPIKPDAIFPNNWVTFHEDGTVILYPMFAPNRRWERRRAILSMLESNFQIEREIDLSHYEEDTLFLEGTGSMVLDRAHKIAYACLSLRTSREVLDDFCAKTGFKSVTFGAFDEQGMAVYHTNVMMSICSGYSVVCLEAISIPEERAMVCKMLEETGKEIVDISLQQVHQYAGNVIELENKQGEKLLVMSEQGYRSFRPEQIQIIEKYARIVHSPLYTIERIGGGGARCMIAEIFLPEKKQDWAPASDMMIMDV